MSHPMPTGTVTLMFTDIEGSTRLWDELGMETMLPVLEAHNALVRQALDHWSGYEVRSEGDAFFLAFPTATDAVQCALEAQLALSGYPWPESTGQIKVRMGIHTGDVAIFEGDYQGTTANLAKRVSDAGHGGQILLSEATHILVQGEFPASWFVDHGAHRLKNLHHPVRMFQLVHPELHRDFPPLRTLNVLPNNLPVQLTSFVGRESEIRQLAALLGKEQVRLVTLTGMGGIGKTRLSIQVAAEQLEQFPDGVWFVSLASLTDPAYVLTEIAAALSISLQPKGDAKKQVIDYLSQKRLLLVLDNFEHLSEAASLVNDLLRGAAALRCLVTSRELLQLPGEQTFVVPPLSTPPADADLQTLSQYDSVVLFLERAKAVKPDFELTPQNAAAVAAICHRLDGISLGIELAAARVRGMTVHQILDRLSRQLEFLTSRSRDVPSRHQTLRGAMEWSYALLSPDEQKLFGQLSVFSGGFFVEAAEAICDVPDALEFIFSLHDKSLLTVEEVMERARYRMLEPLREYAKEKLGEGGELKHAHAAYYLGVAQTCDQKLQGAEQRTALSFMALELDNFRSAMDFAQEQGESKLLGELGVALSWFFDIRGLWSEGVVRLRQAEGALRRLQDNKLLAKVLHWLGKFYQLQGDYKTARNLHTESLQIRREGEDKGGIAGSLSHLGILAWLQGAYDEARQLFQESLQIRRELGEKRGIATSLNNLGNIAENQGRYDEARQLYTESLQIRRELGDKWGIAGSLNNLGDIAWYQGAYDEARQLFQESLQIRRELGDKWGIAQSLTNLGSIAGEQGAYDEARQLFQESLQIYRELGEKSGIAESLNNLGNIAENQGRYDEARQLFQESLQIRRELGEKSGIAESLNDLGEIAQHQGIHEEARQLYTESLKMRRELGDKRGIAISLNNLGEIARDQGAYEEARRLYTESLQIRRELGDKSGIADSLHHFGKLAETEKNWARAVQFLLHAARLYEEMGAANRTEAKEVDEVLAGIQNEIGTEAFERLKGEAEKMGVEQVIDLALAERET